MNRDALVTLSSAILIVAAACGNRADGGGAAPAGGGDGGSVQGGGDGGSVQGGGSPQPFIQVSAATADGTTNAGQGPFRVSYFGAGVVLDDATLSDLSARLSLRTWPEGAAVQTTATIGPIAAGNSATVELMPQATLEDRWYALQLGPTGQGLVARQQLDDGTAGVRLRPGSHPAVRLIKFCSADLPGSKVIVSFSEEVTADAPATILSVSQNGAVVSCRFDDFSAAELHEFCGELVPGPVAVTLLGEKVRGAGAGASVSSGDWTFDTRTLPVVESGWTGYSAPLQ